MNSESIEVFYPADLVQYQPDSIVSRTLINKPTGTVTLFAFARGQSLSEHTAPYDALLQMLDGEVQVRVAGNSYRLAAGQAIILPANQPHAVNAVADCKLSLIMIRS